MGALETFVQNVNAGQWVAAADQLNVSPMYDILPFLAALGPNSAIAANNISGILRKRGWIGAGQRIYWAGEVVRTRVIPNPPQGLPADQVADAQRFLARLKAKASPAARGPTDPFTIEMSSPFRSGKIHDLGGPNIEGHKPPDWYQQFGMDLGVNEGTEILAAFSGYVTKFEKHNPAMDTAKVYGAKLFMRSHNHKMGGYYTHFTGGQSFTPRQTIERGKSLGFTLRDHLHFALVEIIGGTLPGQQPNLSNYVGVNLHKHFVKPAPMLISVTFKQNRSPPDVVVK